MGPANIIELTGAEGDGNYALELRRAVDGTVKLRIFEVGKRVGIASPGGATFAQIASMVGDYTELRITARGGDYVLMRDAGAIRLTYRSADGGLNFAFQLQLSDFLLGLSGLRRLAA